MIMPSLQENICLQAKTDYERLKKETELFEQAYRASIMSSDYEDVKHLKETLERDIHELLEKYGDMAFARKLYGDDFYRAEQIESFFGPFTKDQQQGLRRLPFSRETLQACAGTHVLVADIGMSINELFAKFPDLFDPFLIDASGDIEVSRYNFSKRRTSPTYHLIKKTAISDSFLKTWQQQQDLVDQKTEVILSARHIVYTHILSRLLKRPRSEWPLRGTELRTSDHLAGGLHVTVAYVPNTGVGIEKVSDDLSSDSITLTSMRKADK